MDKKALLCGLLEKAGIMPFHDKEALDAFRKESEMIIRNLFGADSAHLEKMKNISFYPGFAPASFEFEQQKWQEGKEEAAALLRLMIEEIELFDKSTTLSFSVEEVLRRICMRFPAVCAAAKELGGVNPEDGGSLAYLIAVLLSPFRSGAADEDGNGLYFAQEKLVLKVNVVKGELCESIITGLMTDIDACKQRPDCDKLIYFVYDPQSVISDAADMEKELSGSIDGLNITVMVAR